MKDQLIGKKVALGGIITALSVMCMYLSAVVPTGKLTLWAISSMFTLAMVIEFGPGAALVTYAATTVLSFFIVPNPIVIIPYAIFFGYYGIIKYYIEKLHHLVWEWVIKILFFNVFLGLLYLAVLYLPEFRRLVENANIRYAMWVTIVLAEIAFIVYDYGYSLMVGYYRNRLRKMLRF